MFRITSDAPDSWVVSLIASCEPLGDPWPTYERALEYMLTRYGDHDSLVAAADPGLLPEVWESVEGIVLPEETDETYVRDFRGTAWTARDPANMIVPFMLQTVKQDGHYGAEWAGLIEEFHNLGTGTTPGATGRFWNNEVGRSARDMMLGGRAMGVSIDGGSADVTEQCDEADGDGWCMKPRYVFNRVEIMGLTGLPFPAFPRATIRLQEAPSLAAPLVASTLTIVRPTLAPIKPPRDWFFQPEPAEGDSRLVEQYDERTGEYLGMACPMEITDDGMVTGNLGVKGMCHVGYQHVCIPIPTSACSYEHFMVGYVETAEGEKIRTGRLTVGANHADDFLDAAGARSHYEHSGLGWGDVRVIDGEYGPWVSGALSPSVTEAQLRVLRSLTFSGDWREAAGALELIGILDVNYPGFPVARHALAASGLGPVPVLNRARARVVDGRPVMLIAGGVRACPECEKRRHAEMTGTTVINMAVDEQRLTRIEDKLELLLARTEGMQAQAAEAIVASTRRHPSLRRVP